MSPGEVSAHSWLIPGKESTVGTLMGPIEESLREKLFPALFGGGEINANFWQILGCSVNHGGLGIPYPRLSAEITYNTSKSASEELMSLSWEVLPSTT